jgi:hypothetical protein
MKISRWIKTYFRHICRESQNARFMFNNFFPQKPSRLWDNVKKKNMIQPANQDTDDNINWRTRFACCITKNIDTHSEYAILIAFPQQPSLRERAWMLRYTSVASLVGHTSCKTQTFVSFALCSLQKQEVTGVQTAPVFTYYFMISNPRLC